jgi:hypothetical protein
MKALKQDAIQKVEKFISQLQSHEIIIDPKAQTITLKRTLDNRRINLSELLLEEFLANDKPETKAKVYRPVKELSDNVQPLVHSSGSLGGSVYPKCNLSV